MVAEWNFSIPTEGWFYINANPENDCSPSCLQFHLSTEGVTHIEKALPAYSGNVIVSWAKTHASSHGTSSCQLSVGGMVVKTISTAGKEYNVKTQSRFRAGDMIRVTENGTTSCGISYIKIVPDFVPATVILRDNSHDRRSATAVHVRLSANSSCLANGGSVCAAGASRCTDRFLAGADGAFVVDVSTGRPARGSKSWKGNHNRPSNANDGTTSQSFNLLPPLSARRPSSIRQKFRTTPPKSCGGHLARGSPQLQVTIYLRDAVTDELGGPLDVWVADDWPAGGDQQAWSTPAAGARRGAPCPPRTCRTGVS